MKLATYKDGSRDGQLVVVSRDLGMAHYATGSAHTLQQALDDWNFIAPQLHDLYLALNQGRARHAFPFEAERCMAPLPRAFQWAVADAYAGHLDPAGKPVSAGLPRLRQGAGDAFLGSRDEMLVQDGAWAADFGAGLAVVAGDLPAGSSPAQALESIRLLMLANDWCLRGRQADASADVSAVVQAWPATAFGPVAVTLDELGAAWQRGRLKLPLQVELNGRPLGACDAGEACFDFGQLLAQLCRTRALGSGTVLGSGPVCGPAREVEGRPEWPGGCGSITQQRAIETLQGSPALTPYLEDGDVIRLEVKGRDGRSLFGTLAQTLVASS